jgi:hypothetical protein
MAISVPQMRVAAFARAIGPRIGCFVSVNTGGGHRELMRVLTSKTVSPQFRDNVRRAYRR